MAYSLLHVSFPTRSVAALALVGMAIFPSGQAAACCACDPPRAAEYAGKVTTAAINAWNTGLILEQTVEITLALQGNAAQISGNLRGIITGQGLIAEAESNQATQRMIQGDRVAAIKTYQFSTPLCQAATGADIAIAQAQVAQRDNVLASRANAHRTGGYRRPESSATPSAAAAVAYEERRDLFCDPSDPACRGIVGRRPEGDRMPGAMLAMGRLGNADDAAQVAWLINNLTMPVPLPALTDRQVAEPGGQELYIRRGGYETQLNLAKDVVTDTLLTRRRPTADPTYYNQLAAEAGLPKATGNVSQEDMDRMRFRDRFNDKFTTRIAGLGDFTVLTREVVVLHAAQLQQHQRYNEQLEREAALMATVLSGIVEPKLRTTAGNLE